MKIEKKVWPGLFQDILNGNKNFDVRVGDFVCSPGDILVLKEWDPKTKKYTGRVLKKEAVYVLKTKDVKFWSQKDINKFGLQVIGFK